MDLNHYRVHEAGLRIMLNRHGYDDDFFRRLSEFSASSGCPIVAVYCYAAEFRGFFTPEHLKATQRLMHYHIEKQVDNLKVPDVVLKPVE